jgi:hypothetical protein
MMGQCWLGNLYLFQKLAPALLAISQKQNNPKTVGIRKRFANQADLIQLHTITSH